MNTITLKPPESRLLKEALKKLIYTTSQGDPRRRVKACVQQFLLLPLTGRLQVLCATYGYGCSSGVARCPAKGHRCPARRSGEFCRLYSS